MEELEIEQTERKEKHQCHKSIREERISRRKGSSVFLVSRRIKSMRDEKISLDLVMRKSSATSERAVSEEQVRLQGINKRGT